MCKINLCNIDWELCVFYDDYTYVIKLYMSNKTTQTFDGGKILLKMQIKYRNFMITYLILWEAKKGPTLHYNIK